MPRLGRTALILLVPEADPALARIASVYPDLVRAGLPAHLTVLYPWLPAESVDDTAVQSCISLAAAASPIEATFDQVRYKPGMAYAEPFPSGAVETLCEQAQAFWPSLLPYEGKYDDTVPHVTLALGDIEAERASLQELLDPLMPLRSRLADLHVAAYQGTGWNIIHSFPFGVRPPN